MPVLSATDRPYSWLAGFGVDSPELTKPGGGDK